MRGHASASYIFSNMTIIYYVTNHGFGHGVRTAAICNELPASAKVVIRTQLPESFFREEIHREFVYAPAAFDCGCIQSDSLHTDIPATLEAYRAIEEKNRRLLDSEAQWCRSQGASVIVSDIVPFAFDVATRCSLPSIAVTNFTWYDIYKPYCRQAPEFRFICDRIKAQYSAATFLLALEPALPMSYFPARQEIAPIARTGKDRRSEIVSHFRINPKKHIAIIYFGLLGIEGLAWNNLVSLSGWEFFGICPVSDPPPNYHLISKEVFPYQDFAASSDCMVCKLGYSTVAEAMLNGVPVIYLPRYDFAEFEALESAVRIWGGGTCLPPQEFGNAAWAPALEAAIRQPLPRKIESDGARRSADIIAHLGKIRH